MEAGNIVCYYSLEKTFSLLKSEGTTSLVSCFCFAAIVV